MIRHIQNPGIARTVYLSNFKDIQGYSGILILEVEWERQRQSGRGLNRKQCHDLGKNGLDCVQLWIKCSIQNLVLIASRRENSNMLPCGDFFSCVFDEMFIEMPYFHKTFPTLKSLWLCACTQALFLFPKHSILNV